MASTWTLEDLKVAIIEDVGSPHISDVNLKVLYVLIIVNACFLRWLGMLVFYKVIFSMFQWITCSFWVSSIICNWNFWHLIKKTKKKKKEGKKERKKEKEKEKKGRKGKRKKLLGIRIFAGLCIVLVWCHQTVLGICLNVINWTNNECHFQRHCSKFGTAPIRRWMISRSGNWELHWCTWLYI